MNGSLPARRWCAIAGLLFSLGVTGSATAQLSRPRSADATAPFDRALWGTVLPTAAGVLLATQGEKIEQHVFGVVVAAAGVVAGPFLGYIYADRAHLNRGYLGVCLRTATLVGAGLACNDHCPTGAAMSLVGLTLASDVVDIVSLRERAPGSRVRIMPAIGHRMGSVTVGFTLGR